MIMKIRQWLHVSGAHFGDANGEGVLFAFGHYGHDGVFIARCHFAAWRSETWRHDVGSAQNEFDRSLVDLLHGQ